MSDFITNGELRMEAERLCGESERLAANNARLRDLATRYDELQVGAVKAVTMPSDMSSVLREAADTICELRESVHRERAEADRLREELADAPKCEACEAMLDCDECLRADVSHKDRRRISAENAKLREIIADLEELLPESERWYSHETVKAIAEDNAKLRELVKEVFYKLLNVAGGRRELTAGEAQRTMDRMHELGVEVDG